MLTESVSLSNENLALKNVNLVIEAGQKVGICGRSGRSVGPCGNPSKTSLTHLQWEVVVDCVSLPIAGC